MTSFFKKLPFHFKLSVIGLLPLLFLLIISVQSHRQRNEKIAIAQATLRQLERSAAVVQLVDVLQTERRMSFNHVITGGEHNTLSLQRRQTDEAIRNLEKHEFTGSAAAMKEYTFLDKLDAKRRQIDLGRQQPMQVMNYYTNTIFRVNTLGVVATSNIPFMDAVNKDVVGQRLLSEMATYLGNLRSGIYFILYSRQERGRVTDELSGLNDIYRSYITEFKARSSPESVVSLNAVMSSEEMKETNSIINSIFAKGYIDSSLDAEQWWIVSAKAVDKIRGLQRTMLDKVVEEVQGIYKTEADARDRNLVLLIVIVILVLTIISTVIRTVTTTLNEIRNAAQRISIGATDITLQVPSRDVIASLANAIISVDKNNKVLAGAADEIGKGNFQVTVQPRSEEDLLGIAIVSMKEALSKYNAENQRKIWIQTGLTRISDAIRGEKDVNTIAKNVMDVLIAYLDAQVGMVYISASRERLSFAHGHALTDTAQVPAVLAFGQTVIGQAAADKQVVLLENVPEDFMTIATASGNTAARHVLVIPMVHDDELEGVIELGALHSFSPDARALLERCAGNIAIALQAAKSRARLQELLEETQAQSEELQVQHNELENLNAELEAQAQKLQASEEELKVQQEELLQSNQELEERSRLLEERNQLIAERNLEIQKKAEELEMSTKYKSEFLANMSHELRTPLNSILLLSRLLSENHGKNLSPDQVEYAQVIQSSGTGLLQLIDEILDLSKIEAGKMELEFAPAAPVHIAEEMRRLFAPVATEKKISFEVMVKEGVPEVIETDKQRMAQVIKNLLSNAIKFTTVGGVMLEIRPAAKENYLEFCVRDTGIGIPKEKQQLVFEAFQQADGSTRRKFGGTGLGLSISRQLAKLLGGFITLRSEPGQGSEFILSLPKDRQSMPEPEDFSPEPELPDPAEKELSGPDPSAYTVVTIPEPVPDDRSSVQKTDKVLLIVEDDTAFAKALLEFTRKQGYKGIVAVRGDEGIQLARSFHPMGILLDVELPVKNGWQVMEELKSDITTRHIPVHIMSSHTVKKESLMKGAIDFISKPVSPEQIRDIFNKIEHVLNKEHKKVLIIEENTKHAKALAYFLSSYDVNAEISDSIDEGILALTKEDVECVILDMGIPDAAAYKALEKVKENPGLENLPIIIFTGKSLSKTEEERLRQYADTIVVKTAHSYKRMLDEVSLFLHLVEDQKPDKPQKGKLGRLNEVLKDKTVLITDDDVRNIFSLTKALETQQIKVLSATDGKEALRVLDENPQTDVVLMDIMMPEMDGYETMKQIRSQHRYQKLPIIAVTAKAMVGDREKCIKAGASDYISKPVDVDQLLSLLRVWLYDKS